MINRQYCASAYTIDFEERKLLLMYNKKLSKWLQPGGHIENSEIPQETAIRETLEETGVKIKIIGPTYNNFSYHPVAIEHYINSVGDMIDIQFLAIPITKELLNKENNEVMWFPIYELGNRVDIEEDIKIKVLNLYEKYKEIII